MVTGYAFETFEFILCKNFSITFYGFVAGAAFDLRMPALQLKGRLVVVKIIDGPALKPMTTSTVRPSVLPELPAVYRFMATCTCFRKAGKAFMATRRGIFAHSLMAGAAFLPGMNPLQFKPCQPVVEVVFLPTICHMAIPAGLGRIILCIDIPFMDILMAIHATLSYIPESPFIILLMAGKTGRGQMRPVQRELCFTVVLKSK